MKETAEAVRKYFVNTKIESEMEFRFQKDLMNSHFIAYENNE